MYCSHFIIENSPTILKIVPLRSKGEAASGLKDHAISTSRGKSLHLYGA